MIRLAVCVALVLGVLVAGAGGVNVLVGTTPNFYLRSTEYLSLSDEYYLVMQPDCDLVQYNRSGQAVFHTGSGQRRDYPLNCSLWMQDDGNLVIYNLTGATWGNTRAEFAKWAQNRIGDPNLNRSILLLRSNGNLEFYTTDSSTIRTGRSFNGFPVNATSPLTYRTFDPTSTEYQAWEPNASLSEFAYMPAGYFLSAGKRLNTLTRAGYVAELNASDCTLQTRKTLFDGGNADISWKSKPLGLGKSACELALLQNGVLQIRDATSSRVFDTVSGPGGDSLVSWVLKLNPDNGTLSISDITNSTNILWTNESQPISESKSDLGIVVGSVIGAVALVMVILGLYLRKRGWFLDPDDKALQVRVRASGGRSQAFSQAKIKQATNNYARVIGHGGFGDVFYGKLPDGQEVAAKVLSASSGQSKEEFYNEIELLSKVHHKHLVSLLGYSSTRTHQVLIYEFMGGGDLRHSLQGESGAANPLSWGQRKTIILQVAEGLEYLHDKCSPPIIHRDIKSTNILLTTGLAAKVADFGLSKLKAIGQEDATHVTTVVKGTPGYLDPEYHETGLLTEKSDVYAFGVVLMEILTGRHHMMIAQKVGEAWREKQFDGLADPNLGDDFDREELVSLVELALWCSRRSSVDRPLMRQVIGRLHDLGVASSEPYQPGLEFGDELRYSPTNVELGTMAMGECSSDTVPLSSSSFSGLSSEAR